VVTKQRQNDSSTRSIFTTKITLTGPHYFDNKGLVFRHASDIKK